MNAVYAQTRMYFATHFIEHTCIYIYIQVCVSQVEIKSRCHEPFKARGEGGGSGRLLDEYMWKLFYYFCYHFYGLTRIVILLVPLLLLNFGKCHKRNHTAFMFHSPITLFRPKADAKEHESNHRIIVIKPLVRILHNLSSLYPDNIQTFPCFKRMLRPSK